MDPIDFLIRVWSAQGEGFGFISTRAVDNEARWSENPIHFPHEELVLPDPSAFDVYFTPNLFSRPRRSRDYALPSSWLFADLDAVDPRSLSERIRPTVAIESSPSRFQALWHLKHPLDPPDHEVINRKLTYKIEADRGGWDLGQVLRLPGTANHKYPHRPTVQLLWFDESRIQVKVPQSAPLMRQGHRALKQVGIHKKLPTFVRAKVRAKTANGDRSKVLYRMEKEMLSAGFSPDEVFTVLRPSVWNKFSDEGLSADILRVAERAR